MQHAQLPALILGFNVLVYWATVCVLVVRVARKAGGVRHILTPAQPRERLMGLIWTPVILAWIALPLVAASRPAGEPNIFALPPFASWPSMLFVRWLACLIAVACWLASIGCWRHMGRHWRMAVDPHKPAVLLTDGPFALVRHPIYAISILMMLCSVLIVPTWPMAAVAGMHIGLMNLKARNEEAFLAQKHGSSYQAYCRRTGRFIPRLRGRQVPDRRAE